MAGDDSKQGPVKPSEQRGGTVPTKDVAQATIKRAGAGNG
jgi:hypothetical protein